ncbi:hypothetical protein Micbo1qcDRAFT_21864, partial [Microdochium bolleyi]
MRNLRISERSIRFTHLRTTTVKTRFLSKAETMNDIPPPWWMDESRIACEGLGSTRGEWCLLDKVLKGGIVTRYGDDKF